jgi:hypothetical protein
VQNLNCATKLNENWYTECAHFGESCTFSSLCKSVKRCLYAPTWKYNCNWTCSRIYKERWSGNHAKYMNRISQCLIAYLSSWYASGEEKPAFCFQWIYFSITLRGSIGYIQNINTVTQKVDGIFILKRGRYSDLYIICMFHTMWIWI